MKISESVKLFFEKTNAKRVSDTLGLSLSHTYRMAESDDREYLTAQMVVNLTRTFNNHIIIQNLCSLCGGVFMPTESNIPTGKELLKLLQTITTEMKAIIDANADGKITVKEYKDIKKKVSESIALQSAYLNYLDKVKEFEVAE